MQGGSLETVSSGGFVVSASHRRSQDAPKTKTTHTELEQKSEENILPPHREPVLIKTLSPKEGENEYSFVADYLVPGVKYSFSVKAVDDKSRPIGLPLDASCTILGSFVDGMFEMSSFCFSKANRLSPTRRQNSERECIPSFITEIQCRRENPRDHFDV